MLGFHVHFDQGYSNVEKWTSKKILCPAFSVISVYDQNFDSKLLKPHKQKTPSFEKIPHL